jgi:hypothetical protein
VCKINFLFKDKFITYFILFLSRLIFEERAIMNPHLKGGNSFTQQFTVFQPQASQNWGLTVYTSTSEWGSGSMYQFAAFQTDQFNEHPISYRFPESLYIGAGVMKDELLALVRSDQPHVTLTYPKTPEKHQQKMTIIGNHQDGICRSDALLVVIQDQMRLLCSLWWERNGLIKNKTGCL